MKALLVLMTVLLSTQFAQAGIPFVEKRSKFIICRIGDMESLAIKNLNEVNFKSSVTVYSNAKNSNQDLWSRTRDITLSKPELELGTIHISYDEKDKMYTACAFVSGVIQSSKLSD